VFKLFNRVDRELEEGTCLRKGGYGKDLYNVYPEHNLDGSVVFQQRDNTESITFGKNIIEENIKNLGDDGFVYSFRRFASDSHPLYHKEERNLPTKSIIEEETVCDVFGGLNPSLVTPGWTEETWYGDPKKETCSDVIYGTIDLATDIVMPVFMRSYIGMFKDWEDYTGASEIKAKEFFLDSASKKDIVDLCLVTFKDKKIAERVYEALISIKEGQYINLNTLLINNMVEPSSRKDFLSKISFKTKSAIFKPSISIQGFAQYYNYISRMKWISEFNTTKGWVKTSRKLPKEVIRAYKGNMINWVLNHPKLKSFDKNEFFSKDERFWFIKPILEDAIKTGIVKKSSSIIDTILSYSPTKTFLYLGESYSYNNAPTDIQKEYLDSIILRTSTENLYPGMITVKSILDSKMPTTPWSIFCEILDVGQQWTQGEVRLAYEYFQQAYIQDDPSIFWSWIKNIQKMPYETEYTVTEEELQQCIEKTGGRVIGYSFPDIINLGASEQQDGSISVKRIFAANLADAYLYEDSWEMHKKPIYYDATSHVKNFRECNHETFWNLLAKKNIFRKDKRLINLLLSDSTIEETEATEDMIDQEEDTDEQEEGDICEE
jgi:hypothetical protein